VTAHTTRRDLSALAAREFDLVVVGGGIGGAAVAWDAALRGLSVALVERGDFGGATSAESLKVIHGGIRYLQHLDAARVRESSRERSALLRIAPHLAHPLPFVIPTYGHGLRGAEVLAAAFAVLSVLTADRNRAIVDPSRRTPRPRLVSRRQVLDWFPHLDPSGLTGAGVFWDGQLYNPPRLVWAFIRSAIRAGAVIANYCEVVQVLHRDGQAIGVVVEDRLARERFEVRARLVVNAAGPGAEALLEQAGLGPKHTPFSRDMAFVIGRPLVEHRALALQTRYRDPDAILSRGNRHIFLVPWHGRTLIGVHSIIWREHPDELRVPEEQIQEFLAEINEAAPDFKLGREDVALVLAGLLPIQQGELVGANVSFGKRALVVDHAAESGTRGLISAVCNRYTVARGVAERSVDLAFQKLGRKAPPCRTERTPLYGGDIPDFAKLVARIMDRAGGRLDAAAADRLAHNHGSGFEGVLAEADQRPDLAGAIGTTGVLRAEVVHAVRNEMAYRLADVVFNRTDLGTGGDPGGAALAECAGLVADELGWDPARTRDEMDGVRARFGHGPIGFRLAQRH
jgi:glycerol-3-phosphate dehydrogenase